MPRYFLVPLKVAENPTLHLRGLELNALPVYVWYIDGPGVNILIDSGKAAYMPPDLETVIARKGGNVDQFRGNWEAVRDSLTKVNLTPEDIDVVIVSHMHLGHLGYVKEFPKAKFVVQKDELEFALNPLPPYRHLFPREKIYELEKRRGLELVDGDVEIVPGVKVIKCPGHTPGLQVVAIDTSEGVVVFGSELVYTYYSMYPADEQLGIPAPYTYYLTPTCHVSMSQCLASFDKIREIADIIIPSHDNKVHDMVKIPPAPYKPVLQ